MFNPAFKIPNLTVTSASGYNSTAHSDSCSVISLCGSIQSENIFGDLQADDRWSLRSFASGTSCSSRYTSIETLLDQTNRKPVKSSSKLLSVARYFTSSRLRRKLSLRKKQKSLLSRKFSVIDEYKQKGSCSLGFEIDEMTQEWKTFPSRKSSVPGIQEPITHALFDNTEHRRSNYLDYEHAKINTLNVRERKKSTVSAAAKTDFRDRSVDDAIRGIEMCMITVNKPIKNEGAREESNELMISEEDTRKMFEKTYEVSVANSDVSNGVQKSETENMSVVDCTLESSAMKPLKVRRSNSFVLAVNDQRHVDCSSTLSIQSNSVDAGNAEERQDTHSVYSPSQTSYLTESDESHSSSVHPTANSLDKMPARIKRSNSFLLAIGAETTSVGSSETEEIEDATIKRKSPGRCSSSFDVSSFDSVSTIIAAKNDDSKTLAKVGIVETRELESNYIARCSTPPISEMTPYVKSSDRQRDERIGARCDLVTALRRNRVVNYFSITESPEVQRLVLERRRSEIQQLEIQPTTDLNVDCSASNIVFRRPATPPPFPPPSYSQCYTSSSIAINNRIVSVNNVNDNNTNKNNNDHDNREENSNCNLDMLSENLTPSRLFMHANYRNRNTSEGDNDEEDAAVKRDTTVNTDSACKSRTLSESSVSAKGNVPSKGKF